MPHILLVEDDADVRMMIEHVLVNAGHNVVAVATMKDGLGCLEQKSGPYDLVIADAKLPDGTGMAVLDRARESGVKGFIMTGYAFTNTVASLRGYEVVPKATLPQELVAVVNRALRG